MRELISKLKNFADTSQEINSELHSLYGQGLEALSKEEAVKAKATYKLIYNDYKIA